MKLDKAFELAVILAWEDLMKVNQSPSASSKLLRRPGRDGRGVRCNPQNDYSEGEYYGDNSCRSRGAWIRAGAG